MGSFSRADFGTGSVNTILNIKRVIASFLAMTRLIADSFLSLTMTLFSQDHYSANNRSE
jgi:hypothetical protein